MGCGHSGLSLAVQLERRGPGIDVVAELTPHPQPIAAHEVGESTIEAAAHYYREVVGLESHPSSRRTRWSSTPPASGCWRATPSSGCHTR